MVETNPDINQETELRSAIYAWDVSVTMGSIAKVCRN